MVFLYFIMEVPILISSYPGKMCLFLYIFIYMMAATIANLQ